MLDSEFEDVLRAARAGGGWACTRLYEDLAGVVTGYLRQQGAVEPDDVASETFLDVFRSLDRFDGDEAAFRSWVFTIAHRRLVDARRRRGRRPTTTELAPDAHAPTVPGADRPVLAAAGTADLLARLDVLSDAQRDVLLLRVVGGLSVAETAAAVGRRAAAVRQLQRRALRTLQHELAPSTS